MKEKKRIIFVSLMAALVLSACSNDNEENAKPVDRGAKEIQEDTMENHSHSEDNGIPEGLKEAESPAYEPGSTATIKEGHMEGMQGAEATIMGAYDTTAYAISYDPTDDQPRVRNHKWIIQEELKDVEDQKLEVGDEVIITAEHMEGMKDASGTIESAVDTTVYMINYTTASGKEVKNHKWVTGSELEEN